MELWLLAGYLLFYCALHSGLASLRCKRWVAAHFAALMPYYRLGYNTLALLLLLPLAVLVWSYDGALVWQWHGVWGWLMNALALLALIAFIGTLREYDLGQISGSAQLHQRLSDPERQARLRFGWWHRRVRHPWYFFGLVVFWTRDMNAAQLLLYVMLSGYFVIGSKLEERKLIVQFGEAYRRYCQLVPGLIPLPGRSLSRQQAAELEQQARINTGSGR
jgi:protein-S-isoprenylcysteine O-methyltransferase Ste14